MAANVICDNASCDEAGIPKGNPNGYRTEEIVCGVCGNPVAETSEQADMSGHE